MAIGHRTKVFTFILGFFSLKLPLLDHAASFDLNGLKNGALNYFENRPQINANLSKINGKCEL
jgi:hypothetical protein